MGVFLSTVAFVVVGAAMFAFFQRLLTGADYINCFIGWAVGLTLLMTLGPILDGITAGTAISAVIIHGFGLLLTTLLYCAFSKKLILVPLIGGGIGLWMGGTAFAMYLGAWAPMFIAGWVTISFGQKVLKKLDVY